MIFVFLLELLKIVNEDAKTKYPVCIKSAGTAPKQYKQIVVPPTEMTPEALMAAMLSGEHEHEEENEIYKSLKTEGIEEDDLASLEGEEGEEEVAEEENQGADDSEDSGDDFVFGEEEHNDD